MRWLTEAEVEKAGQESRQAAIKYTRKHWDQFYKATAKDLRTAYGKSLVSIKSKYCALCKHHPDCYHAERGGYKCPLCSNLDDLSCHTKWHIAQKAFYAWLAKTGTHKAFKAAAKDLRDHIGKFIKD